MSIKMRIIAGIRKGKKLFIPKISAIRPTMDSTKVIIFNYLGDRLLQAKVLDLFSGTGNLGIEALSRGAAEVIFVEQNRVNSQIIKKNLKLTQFETRSKIIRNDVFRYIKWLGKKKLNLI